jgi:alanine racemase
VLDGIVTWAEIDLDAIAFNIQAFRRHISPDVEVIAVVKANAYGHGAVPVALAALEAGATRLAVHRLQEGIQLRQSGIDAPILIMGYTPVSGVDLILNWKLTPSLITLEFASSLSIRAQVMGINAPVHVKVDTGMGRYGLLPGEVVEFMRSLHRLPNIDVEGMFTHFATADASNPVHTLAQLDRFNQVVSLLEQEGLRPALLHAANSAATMQFPQAHFQAVRIGIAVYGLLPSLEWPPPFEIRPALQLKSLVCRVRELPAGSAIGYGRTFIAQRPTRVALVPVGYGDGYHRILSNKGVVLVGGRRCPVLGRVSMDQIVVDVSQVPHVKQDDEVVLIGIQGEQRLSAEEVAELAGTLNYEVTTSLLPRVTRVYRRGGEVVSVASIIMVVS